MSWRRRGAQAPQAPASPRKPPMQRLEAAIAVQTIAHTVWALCLASIALPLWSNTGYPDNCLYVVLGAQCLQTLLGGMAWRLRKDARFPPHYWLAETMLGLFGLVATLTVARTPLHFDVATGYACLQAMLLCSASFCFGYTWFCRGADDVVAIRAPASPTRHLCAHASTDLSVSVSV
jgi:hypothetical protein